MEHKISINIFRNVPNGNDVNRRTVERSNRDCWVTLNNNDLKMQLTIRNLATTGVRYEKDLIMPDVTNPFIYALGREEMIRKLNEYDDWNRFTINELKKELSRREIPVSGTKGELIKRLIEGSKVKKNERNLSAGVHFAQERPLKKQRTPEMIFPVTQRQPVESTRFTQQVDMNRGMQQQGFTVRETPVLLVQPLQQSTPRQEPKEARGIKRRRSSASCGLFFSLTINELKAALAQRNLKVSGSKDELVHRLTEFEEWNSLSIAEIHAELTCRGLPISGTKGELIERLTAFEEINNMNVNELKAALSARQLPCTGHKDELIVRLMYCRAFR